MRARPAQGQLYRFQVAVADDSDGSVGDFGPPTEAVTTFTTAPGPGPAVTLLPAATPGVLTLVWPAPAGPGDSGGVDVTAYDVYAKGALRRYRGPHPSL